MTTAHDGDNVDLLAVVVKALEPYDIPTGRWSEAEREEPAKAVLAALGLEQVGYISPKGNFEAFVDVESDAEWMSEWPDDRRVYVVDHSGRGPE